MSNACIHIGKFNVIPLMDGHGMNVRYYRYVHINMHMPTYVCALYIYLIRIEGNITSIHIFISYLLLIEQTAFLFIQKFLSRNFWFWPSVRRNFWWLIIFDKIIISHLLNDVIMFQKSGWLKQQTRGNGNKLQYI